MIIKIYIDLLATKKGDNMQKIIMLVLFILLFFASRHVYKNVDRFPLMAGSFAIAVFILSILLYLTLPTSYTGDKEVSYTLLLAFITAPIFNILYYVFNKNK